MYCLLAPNPSFSACSVAKIFLSLGSIFRFVCRGCWRDTAGREGSLPGSSCAFSRLLQQAWLVSAALGPWAGDGLFSTRSCNAHWPSAPRGQKLPPSSHPFWQFYNNSSGRCLTRNGFPWQSRGQISSKFHWWGTTGSAIHWDIAHTLQQGLFVNLAGEWTFPWLSISALRVEAAPQIWNSYILWSSHYVLWANGPLFYHPVTVNNSSY